MNNFVTRSLTSLCAVSICFTPFAIADEPISMPEQEMVALQEQETVTMPEQEDVVSFPEFVYSEENTTEIQVSDDVMGDFTEAVHFFADAAYLYRIHNDAFYHLSGYSDTGSVIQMHDASKWDVHPSQQRQVLYWVTDDDIFIKPKSSCFSSYGYVMHNITKNEAIEVNLRTPPLPMGAYTFRILNIEPNQRLVHLSDGTIWQVSQNDRNFYQWFIGQRLIIGVNNNWKSAELPHILINVDLYKEPYADADFRGNAAVHY